MSTDDFPYDVFLSHSAKDKAVVRPLPSNQSGDCPARSAMKTPKTKK